MVNWHGWLEIFLFPIGNTSTYSTFMVAFPASYDSRQDSKLVNWATKKNLLLSIILLFKTGSF